MTGLTHGIQGNTEWDFDWDSGTLTIFGYGEMAECTEYDLPDRVIHTSPWDLTTPLIRKVVIEDGITSISNDAFCNHYLLESIEIPDSVKVIGRGAFRNCTSLRSITIPPGVTDIEYSFPRCFFLEEINVRQPNPKYYSVDGVLFNKDRELVLYPENKRDERYEVPEGTKTIKTSAFSNNRCLRELVLPEGMERLEDDSILGPEYVETLYIPASLTDLGEYNFLATKEFRVAEGNPMFEVRGGALFTKDGKTLVSYPVHSEATCYEVPEGVEEIAPGAFFAATHLKRVTLPGSLREIGRSAFAECLRLEIVRFDHDIGLNPFEKEGIFEGCGELKIIYADEE